MAQFVAERVSTGRLMLLGRGTNAGDHQAIGSADAQAGTSGQQVDALPLFQIVPALEGAADERNIVGMLVVGLADDARVAVRAAAIVAERELLQGEHALASTGQLEGRRRTHAADADHDRVKECADSSSPHSQATRAKSDNAPLPRSSPGDDTRPILLASDAETPPRSAQRGLDHLVALQFAECLGQALRHRRTLRRAISSRPRA